MVFFESMPEPTMGQGLFITFLDHSSWTPFIGEANPPFQDWVSRIVAALDFRGKVMRLFPGSNI